MPSGLLVHVAGGGDSPPFSVELAPGDRVRFGRGAPGVPVDVRLDNPAVPRLAGEVEATEDFWRLSNFSGAQSLLVENPEGAGEYFRVAPRRVGAPVPFEFARVVLPARGPTAVSFQVYAPGHQYAEPAVGGAPAGAGTVAAFSLDESATYFLVLTALCEPRLRDQSTASIPTTRQVAERLRRHPAHTRLTEQAVGFHLDYLARNKLRVKRAEDAAGRRLEWRRELLVGLALRFGLVHEGHLALLPALGTYERRAHEAGAR